MSGAEMVAAVAEYFTYKERIEQRFAQLDQRLDGVEKSLHQA